MELTRQFEKNVNDHSWFAAPSTIVIAVSTGVDSMTLLDLFLKTKFPGLQIVVAYVDHQLRPESVRETEFIQQYCRAHGITLKVATWQKSQHPQSGVEAAARKFRYEFFAQVMVEVGANYLVTAHHADDLAETVIMKLIRGGWLDSVVGISSERPFNGGKLIRPLLNVTKSDIRKYASKNQLKWFEDQTNYEDDNSRNRIRHEVIPRLQAENEAAVAHIAEFSKQLSELLAISAEITQQQLAGMVIRSSDESALDIKNRDRFSKPLFRAILKNWLSDNTPQIGISNDSLDQLIFLIENQRSPQGEIRLTDNVIVKKSYDKLYLVDSDKKRQLASQKNPGFMLTLDRWYQMNEGHRFGVFQDLPDQVIGDVHELRLSRADLPLFCRPAQSGDKFELESGGHQKVSRLLINQKMPTEKRAEVQVLTSVDDRIVAVLGLRIVGNRQGEASDIYYLIEN